MDCVAARYRFVASNTPNKISAATRNQGLAHPLHLVTGGDGFVQTASLFSRGSILDRNGRGRGILYAPEQYKKEQKSAGPKLENQAIERTLNLPRQAVGG